MGVVFRATDTRLGRDVAIKLLHDEVAHDAARLQRFEQEARATAALNHPNILNVLDIGDVGGVPFIVTELLEGETLRQTLTRGPMPVRQVIDVTVQIARGLAAAHEKGVVHRDLKPENLFLTHDDRVKILDFGLAKLRADDGASGSLSRTTRSGATTTPGGTGPGMVLGTAGYMAPEQVRGEAVDARTDLFALGAVLSEMLSGIRAFQRGTSADTMTAVLRDDPPDLPVVERRIPPALARIVGRCLQKAPGARFQTAADLAFALEGIATSSDASGTAAFPSASVVVSPAIATQRWRMLLPLAAGIAIGVAAWAGWSRYGAAMSGQVAVPPVRLSITPPAQSRLTAGNVTLSLSPAGTRVVFSAAAVDGRLQFWDRRLDRLGAAVLVDRVNGSGFAFWSPDGTSLGFGADGKLKIADMVTGQVRVVCDAPGFRGGAWSADGTIILAPAENSGVSRVPSSGGPLTPVTTVDNARGETSHRYPQFLPDGRRFLFRMQSAQDDVAGLYIGSVDGGTPQRLLAADSHGQYVAQGYLLYVANGTLFAHPFDANRAVLTGPARPLAQNVAVSPIASSAFSASENGVLTYRTGEAARLISALRWVDRTGKLLEALDLPPASRINFDVSRDGRLAMQVDADGRNQGDIWAIDGAGVPARRLTFDRAGEEAPVWSPDGKRLMYFSSRPGPGSLYMRASTGADEEQLLVKSADRAYPGGWAPDGRQIVYSVRQPDTKWDLYTLDVDGSREPQPYARTAFNEQHGQFSPDGRWLAYTSDESGSNEVYVQPFPASSAPKVRISTAGGLFPVWRADGRELFFLSPDRTIVAVAFTTAGGTFRVDSAVPLFQSLTMTQVNFPNMSGQRSPYVPSADGSRFLVSANDTEDVPQQIEVVLNWPALLEQPDAR